MIDDIPVGGGATNQGPSMSDEFAPSISAGAEATGPLEERIVSKNWSIRATAFEELGTLFKNSSSPQDDVFRDHSSNWKKYLNDANPGSLEKCLDALEVFIDKSEPKLIAASQNDIIKILIEKCIGHAKPTIKTKSLECFALLLEVSESFDDSMETMSESLASKNQKDDLEKDFVLLKDKPLNLRHTRSEQEKLKKQGSDGAVKVEEKKVDLFDMMDPVDILSKFNNDWIDKVEEAKEWKEKKTQIEALIADASVPKLKTGDYMNLIKLLKKLILDANVVVSQYSVKVCGILAKGLRKDFEQYAKELMSVLIGRFKEKKLMLHQEVIGVLDSFLECITLETVIGDIITALSDKAPTVKINVCKFIDKAAQQTYIDVLKRISGDLLVALFKLAEDQAGDVRDAALVTVGIMKGRLGESVMSKFLSELNTQKLAKVNDSAQNVQPSKYDKPEIVEKKAPPPQAQKKGPPAKAQPKAQAQQQEEAKDDVIMEDVIAPKQQQKKQVQNTFDDQPIGAKKQQSSFDDQPIGGKKQPAASFDDQPIGGNKKPQFDEQPIGGGSGANAEMTDEMPIARGAYNLDNLGDDAFGGGPPVQPKKKVPPKLSSAKPKVEEEKVAPTEDVEMKGDDDDCFGPPKKVVPKKVAAKPELKPKPTASSTTAKPAGKTGGPNIQEEDIGAGLSKEEAEAKVNEFFQAEDVAQFEESKWQSKVEGFKGFANTIAQQKPTGDIIEALAKFIKMKMKDWKEANVNLNKEVIAIFTVVSQNCEKVNKRAVSCIMPFLMDRIGDPKFMQSVQELIMGLSELVTPKFIATQIIKYAASAKSPNTLKESCNEMAKMVEEFSIGAMPLKEMIDYAIIAANHQNADVRKAAMALFVIMYMHVGEPIKNFLKDIKESTLKLIEEEFAKVVPLKKGEHKSKRGLRGEAAEEGGAGGSGGANLDDALPRQDISKLLTPKLMPMFKDGEWKVRKQAADKVEEMLKQANMRIQPVGLNELMDNLKQRMIDPNLSVLKSFVQLICLLVEALGPASKQYAKKILPPMLQNLANKQSLVRADVVTAMDKWSESAGAEVVINHVGPMLVQENPELRTEALKWIIKNNESIKNSEIKELVKPLISCLTDKTPSIRNLADEVICVVMPLTGYQQFQTNLTDLLPAVQNQIKPILDKIRTKCGAQNQGSGQPVQENMNGSIGQQKQVQQIEPSAPKLKAEVQQAKPQIKPKQLGSTTTLVIPEPKLNQTVQQNIEQSKPLLKKKEMQTPTAQPKLRSDSREVPRGKGLGQSIAQFKEEPQQEMLQVQMGFKSKREEFYIRNKFHVDEIKGEQVERLKTFSIQCMGKSFTDKLFSSDFKQHCECILQFNNLMQESPDSLIEILDIIFKWALIKLADSSNTKFAIDIFDFLNSLFSYLEEVSYQLFDFEANIIIALLCEKTGINNAILKEKVKKLLRMTYNIYDRQRAYFLLVTHGLNAKNLRAVCECLDEVAIFINMFGIDYSQDKELKLVAKMADHSDKAIRENSLKMMGEAYMHLDENIWKVIGEITPKVQGLLEQRFKKLKQGTGLAQSSSSSNFFKGEMGSPRNTQTGKPQTVAQGLKKPQALGSSMNEKVSATPRSNLQFNKSIGKDQPQGNLSKSINQFNASNKSNEEKKVPQQNQGGSTFQKLNQGKTQSSTNLIYENQLQKKAIPQTQRPYDHSSQQDLSHVARDMRPKQNNYMPSNDDEDDQDMRMLIGNDNFGGSGQDFESDQALSEISKHIHQLKYGDLSKRVDSLVSLNEMISAVEQNRQALVQSANELANAFTHVLNDIFDRSIEDIPL